MSLIQSINPKTLAATCHKLAKIETLCRWSIRNEVWKVLESEIIRSSGRFNPMGTANAAWALATAKRSSPAVWNKLGGAALHNIH
eukprot:CAMPEP_0194413198 /NCGR_PEP_ID=MMETSP0176-20130528/11716_1 /TAXON_ID=216777 /ORGANISM="Proboscia alata, Strain PI-D3" /LENGTH=84 /DNA_ID=CAMNT_0039216415 /DNA_START=21 /DNA_END=272 /DNA_ORIENTATION=-